VVFRFSTEAGFEEAGRISTRFDDPYYYYYGTWFTRGVFVGDDVFAVTNRGVRGGPVDGLAEPPYELLLAQPGAGVDLPVPLVR